jgi:hypothetical protein
VLECVWSSICVWLCVGVLTGQYNINTKYQVGVSETVYVCVCVCVSARVCVFE